jgi:hypothetical protein
MHQREALWIDLKNNRANAIKVSVGGINAVTGYPKNVEPPEGQQDYLCWRQPWLDGIATEPGVVKQFVAVDIDDGYTIEEQLTGQVTARHRLLSRLQRTEKLVTEHGSYSTI